MVLICGYVMWFCYVVLLSGSVMWLCYMVLFCGSVKYGYIVALKNIIMEFFIPHFQVNEDLCEKTAKCTP